MKLLIVDDSALMRGIVKEVLSQRSTIEVAGEAANGLAGYEMSLSLKPDVIVMDINMPVMNGLEATRRIMAEQPVPIIIFSSAVDAAVSFEAITAGAFEVLKKPDIDRFNDPSFANAFLDMIESAGKTKRKWDYGAADIERRTEILSIRTDVPQPALRRGFSAVVLGASTGGPIAVRNVLAALPGDFPLGIAVVQHLEEGFDEGYAQWLDEACALEVRLSSEAPEAFKPGTVAIARVNKHLVVADGKLALGDGPRVLNQKPAVDVLFESAAEWFGNRVIGILLTGMGRDGAAGCKKIRDKGGYTLVQDQATSAIFSMPKTAIELGGASEVLPLAEIPKRLLALVGRAEGGKQ